VTNNEDCDTVGAVALDTRGNFAYATSTGGITAKQIGRVGDTPITGEINDNRPYLFVVRSCAGAVVGCWTIGCSDLVIYTTEVGPIAINLKQVVNLLCIQINSASYPQWDGT